MKLNRRKRLMVRRKMKRLIKTKMSSMKKCVLKSWKKKRPNILFNGYSWLKETPDKWNSATFCQRDRDLYSSWICDYRCLLLMQQRTASVRLLLLLCRRLPPNLIVLHKLLLLVCWVMTLDAPNLLQTAAHLGYFSEHLMLGVS